jgi:hypothetical protein
MKTLSPLIERIEADIMCSDLLHADDTPIRVLDRICGPIVQERPNAAPKEAGRDHIGMK